MLHPTEDLRQIPRNRLSGCPRGVNSYLTARRNTLHLSSHARYNSRPYQEHSPEL